MEKFRRDAFQYDNVFHIDSLQPHIAMMDAKVGKWT